MGTTYNNQNTNPLSFKAKDTSVVRNRLVKLDTVSNQVAGTTAASDKIIGVAQSVDGVSNTTSAAGDPIAVADLGVQIVEAGAAVTLGDLITSDGSSRGITATTGNVVVGRALQAAGGAGELIPVKLFGGVYILSP